MTSTVKAISQKQHRFQIDQAVETTGYCFAVAVFPSGKMPKFYSVFSDLDEAKAFSYDLHKKLKNPSEDFVGLYFHTAKAGGDSFGYINMAACEKNIRFILDDSNTRSHSLTLTDEGVIVTNSYFHDWFMPMPAFDVAKLKQRIVQDPSTIYGIYEVAVVEQEQVESAPMIVNRANASDRQIERLKFERKKMLGLCHPRFREMALSAPQFDDRYWDALSQHWNGETALVTMSEAYMVGQTYL